MGGCTLSCPKSLAQLCWVQVDPARTLCTLPQIGWPATFLVFGLAGVASSALTSFTLPAEGPARAGLSGRRRQQQKGQQGAAAAGGRRLAPGTVQHLALLCFTHSIISWSFFILQVRVLVGAGVVDIGVLV